MEIDNNVVTGFKEKPTYTHYSNAGIYIMKREVLSLVPSNKLFNATDLMQNLINEGKKVVSYPFTGYWLDIGRLDDFERAQNDISKIKF
jgi:NDP-sugar pyrophosphorylase family protein